LWKFKALKQGTQVAVQYDDEIDDGEKKRISSSPSSPPPSSRNIPD
jgi:hypothetical protein